MIKKTFSIFLFIFFIAVLSTKTYALGENGAVLSVGIFSMLGAVFFFILPLMLGQIVKNEVYNQCIKQAIYGISFYMLVLSGGVIMELANFAGLPTISSAWETYIFIFTTIGWLLMAAVAYRIIFNIIMEYTGQKKKKRMGGDDDE